MVAMAEPVAMVVRSAMGEPEEPEDLEEPLFPQRKPQVVPVGMGAVLGARSAMEEREEPEGLPVPSVPQRKPQAVPVEMEAVVVHLASAGTAARVATRKQSARVQQPPAVLADLVALVLLAAMAETEVVRSPLAQCRVPSVATVATGVALEVTGGLAE